MKKIAFISPGKLPQPATKGGAVEGLIDLLVKSTEDEYEVHVYSVGENDEDIKNGKVEYHYVKNTGLANQISRKIRGVINILRTNSYCGNNYINKVAHRIVQQKDQFDIIIVQNVPEYGLVLQKCNARHYILHMHNNNFSIQSNNARKIFDLYDEIYTISETVRRYVCSIEESEKVKVLYNGVDNHIFGQRISNDEKQDGRTKLGFMPEDVVFVFAGRLTQEKGVKELILSFRKLAEIKENVKLMIIGSSFFEGAKETEYVSELKKIAAPVKDKIVFTGFINHEELYRWYQLGNIGVVPSQWDEPFALTVIEEMMCGLPVIASKCGGIVEITNSDCAILVEQNDTYIQNFAEAMRTLSEDKNQCRKMSDRAVDQANKFNSNRFCDTFKRYIDALTEAD